MAKEDVMKVIAEEARMLAKLTIGRHQQKEDGLASIEKVLFEVATKALKKRKSFVFKPEGVKARTYEIR